MRKSFVFIMFTLLLILAACGGGGDKKANSGGGNDVLEADIVDVSFVVPSDSDGYDEDGNDVTAKIDLDIKNISDKAFDLFAERDVYLYDGDSQQDALSFFDTDLDIEGTMSTKIGSDKKRNFSVYFEVDLDNEYEVYVEPSIVIGEEDMEPISLPLDLSEYADEYEALGESVGVLENYINTVFLDDGDEDALEEVMDINLSKIESDNEKEFIEFLKGITFEKLSSKQAAKAYKTFKKRIAEEAEIDVSLKAATEEKAILSVEYTGITKSEARDVFDDFVTKYQESKGSYYDEAMQYGIDKIDEIIEAVQMEELDEPMEIVLEKNDDKWEFGKTYSDTGDKILSKNIIGGSLY